MARPRRRWPRRWWLFRPFDLVARLWPVWRPRRGALVVRIDGIGDMILAQGAVRHYPAALGMAPEEITVLGCHSWASLAEAAYPGFRFYPIDEGAYDRNPFYRLKVSLWVRRQGFAVAICDSYLRKPLLADSLVYVSGAPRRIVSKPFTSAKTEAIFGWYLTRCGEVIDTGPHPTHEVVRHFRLLPAIAGRRIPAETPVLPWQSGARPLAAPYAVLNIGGNEPGRRWPLGAFLNIAEHLAARGLDVVFHGGPRESALREEVAAAAAASPHGSRFIDRIASLSLGQLLDLLQHAELVISGETGPAHLAVALGAPTIVAVGGGSFGCFMPFPAELTPPQVRFLWRELPCYGCFWNCTQPHPAGESFPCLDAVSVAEVRTAADQLLAARLPADRLAAQSDGDD